MKGLNEKIQEFYDDSSELWIERWGEHMHHGYYGPDGKARKDRLQAQEDMIIELLNWAGIEDVQNMLDLGCGAGGSARFMSRRYKTSVLGLTLSPVQADIARKLNLISGLEHKINIRVQDMMTISRVPAYDLIWSMESAEHIADKAALLEICHDTLVPEGRLIMATWCVREKETGFSAKEKSILKQISKHYHLPPMVSILKLENLAQKAGFKEIQTADWSPAVAPFWGAVIRSALSFRSIRGLIRSGWGTIKGAWAMRYMQKGFRCGLIQFGVLHARK